MQRSKKWLAGSAGLAALVAGGAVLASGGTAASVPTPSLQAFDKAPVAADAVDGKLPSSEQPKEARRIASAPAGWKAWLTKGTDPATGDPQVCLLIREPDAPVDAAGPATFCASNAQAAKFGVGGSKVNEATNEVTLINYLPAGASITATRGAALPNSPARPGVGARGQLSVITGVGASAVITAANGDTLPLGVVEDVQEQN